MNLPLMILIAGLLHFGILVASALTPQVLNWRRELQKLDPLTRQLVWVHGGFIVLVILGFGTLSIALPSQLAAGTPLARSLCAFIAVFWLTRLALQYTVFDAKPHLTTPLLRLGYHGLTVVFLYHVFTYGAAAIVG
jgi:hypothetical protein